MLMWQSILIRLPYNLFAARLQAEKAAEKAASEIESLQSKLADMKADAKRIGACSCL